MSLSIRLCRFITLMAAATCLVVRAGDAANTRTVSLGAWLADQPGGVVAAVVDVKGVHFFTVGVYDPKDRKAITADTFFEIGSLTKTFTALLLADAVERHELALTDPIATAAGIDAPSEVTFERLATHHAGFARLPAGFKQPDPANPYAAYGAPELIGSIRPSLVRPAGTAFEYSNLGAAVLGLAVAQVAHRPYPDLMRKRVLDPLEMPATQMDWRAIKPDNLAPGHTGGIKSSNWDFNAFAPAGAMVSNARELARYVEAMLGIRETPLRPAIDACLKPRAGTDRKNQDIGLAWLLNRRPDGTTVVWHNGGTGGYRSFVALDRAKRRGVALLTNHDTSLDALGIALLMNEPFAPPPKPPPPASALRDYLGQYRLTPTFVIAVTAGGNRLYSQASGQSRLELRRAEEDRFKVVGPEATLRFIREPNRGVVALILEQNGAEHRGERIPPEAPAAAQSPTSSPPSSPRPAAP